MADAARENEQVPDGVAVGNAFGGEEDDATGIGQSTSEQPDYRGQRKVRDHRLGRDDNEPPHGDVHGGGQDCKAFHEPKFEQSPQMTPKSDQPQGPRKLTRRKGV